MTDDPATEATDPVPRTAEEAARAAAEAAEQARRAQQEAAEHAERARRLTAEYARLAAAAPPEPEVVPAAAVTLPDAVEPDDVPADDETAPGPDRRLPLLLAAGLLVAAVAFAAVALALRLTAHSGNGTAGATRDAALLDARQDIVVLNSLDYRSVNAGLSRWATASTGALHQSLTHVGSAARKQIVTAKKVTTATVLDAAVVSLDGKAGTATVIASVELHVAPANGGTATVRRERLQAQLRRVGTSWKVASLEQVGVTVG